MRISVVIATRNRAGLLRLTLEQLGVQQYHTGDEVIVVDNASTDGTAAVVREATSDFPVPLRYVREEAFGKSPAVNAGVLVSQGDVLALTDDDVLVADNWIATIRRLFSDSAVELAGGRVDPWWEAPPPPWLNWDPDATSNAMLSPLALLHYGEPQPLGDRTAVGANLIVRRETYLRLGGFNPDLGRQQGTLLCGEDHDFCLRATAAGCRCEYRPEIRVRHWVPSDRLHLRYHLRWFFWSGITNARLDSLAVTSSHPEWGCRRTVRHMVRRLGVAAIKGTIQAVIGRRAKAVMHAMSAAVALGYIVECSRNPSDREPIARGQVAGPGTRAA